MKRIWVIPAILVAGVTGLGGLAYAASAQDAGWRDGRGYSEGRDHYCGRRWNDDDRRRDDDRGPRWRDDDRSGHGPREGRRGDDRCGGRDHGWRRGHGSERHGSERHGRSYDQREDRDRGYRGHGYHHRHHGHGGPRRFGRAFDPARLDSVKTEIGVTTAQELVWSKYVATLKEVADARKARRDSIDRGAVRRMAPDEFRKFRDGMIDQRRKEQDSVNAAVDEFVKSLDEKQVAIAKEVLPGYAFGRGMRGAGMGWDGSR